RFANFAAVALAVLSDKVVERFDLVDLDDVEQFLPRVRKVLAEVVDDRLAGSGQLLLQDVRDQWDAAAASRPGLRPALQFANRREAFVANGLANLAFADVVAGADLSGVG